MEIGYYTDKGKKRTQNEDAIRVLTRHNVFMLADGVGGNRAGEIASNRTLDIVSEYFENNPIEKQEGSDRIFRYFEDAVDYVNEAIKQMAHSVPECAGMATTLVFAYVRDRILYIANIEPTDRILLSSDGLYDEVSEEEILELMTSTDDMKACAKELVDRANANGGNDNISVICVSMVEDNYE